VAALVSAGLAAASRLALGVARVPRPLVALTRLPTLAQTPPKFFTAAPKLLMAVLTLVCSALMAVCMVETVQHTKNAVADPQTVAAPVATEAVVPVIATTGEDIDPILLRKE